MNGDVRFEFCAGATYDIEVFFRDLAGALIDVTGYSGELEVTRHESDGTETEILTVAATVGGQDGRFTISLTAEQTSAIDSASRQGSLSRARPYFRVRATPPAGVEFTLVRGPARIRDSEDAVLPFRASVQDQNFQADIVALASRGAPGADGADGEPGAPGAPAEPYSAKAAATSNVASLSGTTTQDGVALNDGDDLFLPHQNDAKENGPWVVRSGGPWERPAWFDDNAEVKTGFQITIAEGGSGYGGTVWALVSPGPLTLGVSDLNWAQVGGSGASVGHVQVDIVIVGTHTLSGGGTYDGVTLTNSTTALYVVTGATAGIYTVNTSGSWSRSAIMDTDADVARLLGAPVFVLSGTDGAGSRWELRSGSTLAASKVYRRLDALDLVLDVTKPPYNVRSAWSNSEATNYAAQNTVGLKRAISDAEASGQSAAILLPNWGVIRHNEPLLITEPNIHLVVPRGLRLRAAYRGGVNVAIQSLDDWPTGDPIETNADFSLIKGGTNYYYLDYTDAGLWIWQWTTFQVEGFIVFDNLTGFNIFHCGGRRIRADAQTWCFRVGVNGNGSVNFVLRTGGPNGTEHSLTTAAGKVSAGSTKWHFSLNYDGSNIRCWVTEAGATASASPDAETAATGVVTQKTYERCILGRNVVDAFGRYQNIGGESAGRIGSWMVRQNAGRSTGGFTAPTAMVGVASSSGMAFQPTTANRLSGQLFRMPVLGGNGFALAMASFTEATTNNCNFSSVTGGGLLDCAFNAGTNGTSGVRVTWAIRSVVDVDLEDVRVGIRVLSLSYNCTVRTRSITAKHCLMELTSPGFSVDGNMLLVTSHPAGSGSTGGEDVGSVGFIFAGNFNQSGLLLYQPSTEPDTYGYIVSDGGGSAAGLVLSAEDVGGQKSHAGLLIGNPSNVAQTDARIVVSVQTRGSTVPIRLRGSTRWWQIAGKCGAYPASLPTSVIQFDSAANQDPIEVDLQLRGFAAGTPLCNVRNKVYVRGTAGSYDSGTLTGDLAAVDALFSAPSPGVYEISGYVSISDNATTGTLEIGLTYNDGSARSVVLATGLDMTSSGPGFHQIQPRVIRVASGTPQISATFDSLTGTPGYRLELAFTPKKLD